MSDASTTLSTLKRPSLLVTAARRGLSHYKRERDLRRILKTDRVTTSMVERLMDAETALEATRQSGNGTYSVAQHVTVLTALIAEAAAIRTAPLV